PDGARPRIERFADTFQWERWLRERERAAPRKSAARDERGTKDAKPTAKKRLSYKEKLELEGMEGRILEREGRLEELKREIALPEVASDAQRLMELTREMAELEAEIETLYDRWAVLSSST